MRILITGASGFAGRHLAALFVRGKHQLFGTYSIEQHSPGMDGIALEKCDVRNFDRVRTLLRQVRPAHIYHLAALSSPRQSIDEPQKFLEVNVGGTRNVLEAARLETPDARILCVSSGLIYEIPRSGSVSEKARISPSTPYAESKALADATALEYFSKYGLHVVRARPFNHTGPGQSTDFVCSDFARQIIEIEVGRRIALEVGRLELMRDFSDVRDVVRAYALLIGRGRAGQAYNVGSGSAISLKHVVTVLTSFSSVHIPIQVRRSRFRKNEPRVIRADIKRIKKEVGWNPRIQLEKTLRALYRYWRMEVKE